MNVSEVKAMCPQFKGEKREGRLTCLYRDDVDGNPACQLHTVENGDVLVDDEMADKVNGYGFCHVALAQQSEKELQGKHVDDRERQYRYFDKVLTGLGDPTTMRFSYSRINLWLGCRYKWFLTYVEKLKPEVPPKWALVGRAYHKGLENFYVSKGEHIVIPSTNIPSEDAKIRAVLDGLSESKDPLLYTPGSWATEKRYDFDLFGAPFQAVIDLYEVNDHIVVDWKTTQDASKLILLDVLYQMALYLECHKALNVPVKGIQVRALSKPGWSVGPKWRKNEPSASYAKRLLVDVKKYPKKYYIPYDFKPSEIDSVKYARELFGVRHEIVDMLVHHFIPSVNKGEYDRALLPFLRNRYNCSIAGCEFLGECKARM